MVISVVRDAVDQLDGPATIQHTDADFDAFKATAQSIVKQESTGTTTVDDAVADAVADASLQLNDESFASDTFHTADCSEREQDPPLTAEGVRRFVSPKDFELLKVIGMGAFGKVLQVRNKESKKVLAMKVISKRVLRRKGDGVIENVLAERNILRRVRHPFVVQMHCSFQSREKLFIIMDFLAGGELFLRLGREGIFLEKTVSR
jgi:hypothetical protein